ncbi:7-deoxyloganetin glucosyltransferase-like [Neltuma alba]|uniref:7-deoxyloganetin glucosyltransferase-like n=1 Tax=Neltuma alba TaxID=207710 RepID=UPI0010A4B22A|nr:7-deoxyloganetin glucosyltransferase-like [Prosopis alba]
MSIPYSNLQSLFTFINIEFNHKHLLKSQGTDSFNGLSSFRFKTIPKGIPSSNSDDVIDTTQDIPSLYESTCRTCPVPFRNLLNKLSNSPYIPPIACIVSDGIMSFAVNATKELRIPNVLFWTTNAYDFLYYVHFHRLIEKGLISLKDSSDLTNGYLENIGEKGAEMKKALE